MLKYSDYLKSKEWKNLSKRARERANWKCEFCGEKPDDVHHIKYPKNFVNDCLENLNVCCKTHHKLQHGVRGIEAENNNKETEHDEFHSDQRVFCISCKTLYDINDMDRVNDKWLCRSCEDHLNKTGDGDEYN